uniref:Uncharacterized protein n=1 Tax=Arundo donax TaxID=35708 RepID=A0A0A8ZRH9_ARUDO
MMWYDGFFRLLLCFPVIQLYDCILSMKHTSFFTYRVPFIFLL